MRKLATVTAALALVAVMIAFPAPTVWAGGGSVDVAILKCSESITTTRRGVLVEASEPTVVVFQSTFVRAPGVCEASTEEPNDCAPCLAELNNFCEGQAAFLVNDRVTEIAANGQQNPNHPSDDFNLNSFSIEKYVFSGCNFNRAVE